MKPEPAVHDAAASLGTRALAVLPARLASTRLPRKVLLDETGLPLFVHAARNAMQCPSLGHVLVATDDQEVLASAERHAVAAVLTDPNHVSGTDRVFEALGIEGREWDVVVNIQADEPEVDPMDIEDLIAAFRDPGVQIATLCVPCAPDEVDSPNVVKVVRDAKRNAMYFSRASIPNGKHARNGAQVAALRHLGVYAFRPHALARCCALAPGHLESVENLEQLRWLEAGEEIRVLNARRAPRGIDTQVDYDAFVALYSSGQKALPPSSR